MRIRTPGTGAPFASATQNRELPMAKRVASAKISGTDDSTKTASATETGIANATRAQKAGWFQKWSQLRLRPEEYGARVHVAKAEANHYGLDDRLLRDPVLQAIAGSNPRSGGRPSYLLPMTFAEGCPTHPAYPSGQACVAGACVTILSDVQRNGPVFCGVSGFRRVRDRAPGRWRGAVRRPEAEQARGQRRNVPHNGGRPLAQRPGTRASPR